MANGEPEKKSFGYYFYWKFDRNLCILGIIGIALASFYGKVPNEAQDIAKMAITALSTYAGVRTAK